MNQRQVRSLKQWVRSQGFDWVEYCWIHERIGCCQPSGVRDDSSVKSSPESLGPSSVAQKDDSKDGHAANGQSGDPSAELAKNGAQAAATGHEPLPFEESVSFRHRDSPKREFDVLEFLSERRHIRMQSALCSKFRPDCWPHEHRDLVQETTEALLHAAPSYDGRSNERTW